MSSGSSGGGRRNPIQLESILQALIGIGHRHDWQKGQKYPLADQSVTSMLLLYLERMIRPLTL